MTKFEELLEEARQQDITVMEDYDLSGTRIKGLYCDGFVALSDELETEKEKSCILAEEIGHHDTAVGDLLDQSLTANRKQELKGRVLAYDRLIGLHGIVETYRHHCQSVSECAEYLEVTEEFFMDAVCYYHTKYGAYTSTGNYIIYFEPAVGVMELI